MDLAIRDPSVDSTSDNPLEAPEIPWDRLLTRQNCKAIWTLARKDLEAFFKRHRESRPEPPSGGGGGWYEDPFGGGSMTAEDTVEGEEEDQSFLNVPPSKQLSNIVFDIRHKFFTWVMPQLEACCLSFAQRKLGPGYLRSWLQERALEDVSQIDLEMWKNIFDQAYRKGDLVIQDFCVVLEGASRSDIFIGIEQLRHATVHRRDMEVEVLLDAMCLPELLGERTKQAVVKRVFDFASEDQVSQHTIDILDQEFASSKSTEFTTQTGLFGSFQVSMEESLWEYTRQHHDRILESRQWDMPEQGEMPQWEEIYRDSLPAIQDDFPDRKGKLLATCLSRARCLRNDVAHRHWRGDEDILAHVHNSIRTSMVLGDYPRALEIEIAAERWYTKATRVEVLLRLRDQYLQRRSDNIADPLAPQREFKRRNVIRRLLIRARLPFRKALTTVANERSEWFTLTDSIWDTWISAYERYEWFTLVDSIFDTWTQGRPAPKHSCTYWWHFDDCAEHAIPDYSLPEQFRLTPPDDWDTLRETFSDSMHPALKVLHEPQWSTIWDLDAALDHPDFPLEDSWGNGPGITTTTSLPVSSLSW